MDEGQNMMMAHHDGVDGTEERKHSSCLQPVLVLVVHDRYSCCGNLPDDEVDRPFV